MRRNIDIRPATPEDASALTSFLGTAFHVHRHLDWRTPQDWLPYQPFWLLTEGKQILAALACPSDPPEINWIRLFAVSSGVNHPEAWKILLNKALETILTESANLNIAAVSLKDWFTETLVESGFHHHQDIVVLEWEFTPTPGNPTHLDIHIRKMEISDLNLVAEIDHNSFEYLWRNSISGIEHSFAQSAYAAVAEMNGQIVGFQISTQNPFSAHLARLAVLPGNQRKGIGYELVSDLLKHFISKKVFHITVNTQSDNLSSLSLYNKLGFIRNDDYFPVYLRNLDNN